MVNWVELDQVIRELFNSRKFATLATSLQDRPYCNLVAFAASEDLKFLAFATEKATRKYENLKLNPHVALLIQDAVNDMMDFSAATAVTVIGEAHEIVGEKKLPLQQLYLAKHPNLTAFITSTDCAFMLVEVSQYVVVRNFQEVSYLKP